MQASVFIGHDGHRGAEESLELVLALVQRLGIAAGGHLTEKALDDAGAGSVPAEGLRAGLVHRRQRLLRRRNRPWLHVAKNVCRLLRRAGRPRVGLHRLRVRLLHRGIRARLCRGGRRLQHRLLQQVVQRVSLREGEFVLGQRLVR